MSADIFFYKDNYGVSGLIPAAEFPLWERRADSELCRITGGKSRNSEDVCVKRCICEMAEHLFTASKRNGIASENNDGYSVSYTNGDINLQLKKIAERELFGTDYLFRGVLNEN